MLEGYPLIMNGDHAEFEQKWAASGRPARERPDWPLPSFDATEWAAEFKRICDARGFTDCEGREIDEGWLIAWFANALQRGYDERRAQEAHADDAGPLLSRIRLAWHVLTGRADAIRWR